MSTYSVVDLTELDLATSIQGIVPVAAFMPLVLTGSFRMKRGWAAVSRPTRSPGAVLMEAKLGFWTNLARFVH